MSSYLKPLVVVWIGLVACGAAILGRYSGQAGAPAVISENSWPRKSKLDPVTKPTFLVFAHPRCPCTSATMGELERLMPVFKDKVDVRVVFIQPLGRDLDWVQADLWRKTVSIPGVQAVVDPDGREAEAFGAMTSGQSFFYDVQGNLLFSGGITPARGHMGDSVGRDFMMAWMNGNETPKRAMASVYGCALKRGQPLRPAADGERVN